MLTTRKVPHNRPPKASTALRIILLTLLVVSSLREVPAETNKTARSAVRAQGSGNDSVPEESFAQQLLHFRSLLLVGNWTEAEKTVNELLNTARRVNDGGLALARAQLEASSIYSGTGRWPAAKTLLLAASATLSKRAPKSEPEIAIAYNKLSAVLLSMDDLKNAEHFNQKALAACKQITAQKAMYESLCRHQAALIALAKHEIPPCLAQLDTAFALIKDDPKQVSLQAELLNTMSQVREFAGEPDLAYQLSKEAVRLSEQSSDPFNPVLAKYLTQLASCAINLRSWSEAAGYIDRALDVERSYHKSDSPLTIKLGNLRELVSRQLKTH